jgi:hypothetical protein
VDPRSQAFTCNLRSGGVSAPPTDNRGGASHDQQDVFQPSEDSVTNRHLIAACLALLACPAWAWAQNAKETLIVAGPRTPESAELEYPATEAVHEMPRNIYERLLAYEMITNKDGVRAENFDKLTGALAESWDVAPDSKSITFHLRPAKAGNADRAPDCARDPGASRRFAAGDAARGGGAVAQRRH